MRVIPLVSALVFLTAGYVYPQSGNTVSDSDVIEELEVLEDVTEEVSSVSPVISWLGQQHPATVHFPIAWVVLLAVVELIAMLPGKASWHRAGFYLLVASIFAFVPAATSGLAHASLLSPGDDRLSILSWHRNLNLGILFILLAALAVRGRKRTFLDRRFRYTYLALIAVATVSILIAGHLGGRMVHT